MPSAQNEEARTADRDLRRMLADLRDRRQLSNEKLAEKINFSTQTVRSYLSEAWIGKGGNSFQTFLAILGALAPKDAEARQAERLYHLAHGRFTTAVIGEGMPDDGFLGRNEVAAVVGSLEERMDNARTDLVITGNDCLETVQGRGFWVRRALAREVNVKILGVSPEASGAVAMLQLIDPRFPHEGNLRDSIDTLTRMLESWCAETPAFLRQLEYRLLPVVPALGFLMADMEDDGPVKCEIYTPQDASGGSGVGLIGSRPHFVPKGRWRPYYVEMFRRYWEMATPVALVS